MSASQAHGSIAVTLLLMWSSLSLASYAAAGSAGGRVTPAGIVAGDLTGNTTCSEVMEQTCFPGDDLKTVERLTKDQCCQACLEDPQCVSYTLNYDGKPHATAAAEGACHLKTGVGRRVSGNCTSGLSGRPIPGPPAPPPAPPTNTTYCKTHKCRNVL